MQGRSFHVGSNMGSVPVNRGDHEQFMLSVLDDERGAKNDPEVHWLRFE